jgi:hypothetical protein
MPLSNKLYHRLLVIFDVVSFLFGLLRMAAAIACLTFAFYGAALFYGFVVAPESWAAHVTPADLIAHLQNGYPQHLQLAATVAIVSMAITMILAGRSPCPLPVRWADGLARAFDKAEAALGRRFPKPRPGNDDAA